MDDFKVTSKLIKNYLPSLNICIDEEKKTISINKRDMSYLIKFKMDGVHLDYLFNNKHYMSSTDLIFAIAVKTGLSIKTDRSLTNAY